MILPVPLEKEKGTSSPARMDGAVKFHIKAAGNGGSGAGSVPGVLMPDLLTSMWTSLQATKDNNRIRIQNLVISFFRHLRSHHLGSFV